ncbi:MAG: polyprenyl diphosphate synthase [Tenericutes bacterium]|nr:polyprenyl diphosphate synthase [Mycoplasmatota bacterium]
MNKDFIIPCHVGIIMDGNGRWATKRGFSRSVGHKAGADNIKKLCLHAADVGVKYLSLYAFSTENFKRSAEEVNFLMDLFIKVFTTEFKVFEENNVKVLFSGRREPLSKKVLETMDGIVERTKNNTDLVLNICLNYGGQSEIADTTKKICQMYKDGLIKLEDITPEFIQHNLYQDLPPLDFVIRTSGELRTSNFMPYQSSYAEYYFPKILFPDFDNVEFDKAIEEFNKRNRRFGGYDENKSN